MNSEIEGFEPNTVEPAAPVEDDPVVGFNPYDAGFEDAAKIAIEFAEQLAPGRNGGKRMREHFEAIRAKAQG